MLCDPDMMGFEEPLRAVIIGARGGIGAAFTELIAATAEQHRIWATSTTGSLQSSSAHYTSKLDITDENSLRDFVSELQREAFAPNLIINCSGLLHTSGFGPERSWRHLDIDVMRTVFDVNTFGVALLGKHLIPLINRRGRSVFASLSARVGSISDNRLGGWYSYRASKAAQNMIIKGLAIEASMRWRELICVALHPGTVATDLSKPFAGSVPPEKLFTPDTSAQHLSRVVTDLTSDDTGQFFAWDGQPIHY